MLPSQCHGFIASWHPLSCADSTCHCTGCWAVELVFNVNFLWSTSTTASCLGRTALQGLACGDALLPGQHSRLSIKPAILSRLSRGIGLLESQLAHKGKVFRQGLTASQDSHMTIAPDRDGFASKGAPPSTSTCRCCESWSQQTQPTQPHRIWMSVVLPCCGPRCDCMPKGLGRHFTWDKGCIASYSR